MNRRTLKLKKCCPHYFFCPKLSCNPIVSCTPQPAELHSENKKNYLVHCEKMSRILFVNSFAAIFPGNLTDEKSAKNFAKRRIFANIWKRLKGKNPERKNFRKLPRRKQSSAKISKMSRKTLKFSTSDIFYLLRNVLKYLPRTFSSSGKVFKKFFIVLI